MLVTKPRVETVRLADIAMDKTTQMRSSLNRNAILDYAEAEANGVELPPIVVFRRQGVKKIWVGDGWHRILARKRNGQKTIRAEVRDGTRRDAVLYAAGANQSHGVRRTNEDKRKAVIVLLKDSEWRKWADTEIAKACGVSAGMVAKYREWFARRRRPRRKRCGRTLTGAARRGRAPCRARLKTPTWGRSCGVNAVPTATN